MDEATHIDMNGKVAVVTGGSSGIGKEIARGLARMGAQVVIAARDVERGARAAGEITAGAGRGEAVAMRLDVSDPASVRAFAGKLAEERPRVDLLVNNAGAWFTERKLTSAGRELTFATNVLGPFLLTELLLDSLRAAGRARIVNIVSSISGNYDADDLDFARRRFKGFKAYAQSKQALRMLTWGLAARLEGSGITVNAAAPGFVRTGFNRNARGPIAVFIGLSARLFAVPPDRGAETPLWVATAPELDGMTGRYFDGRREKDGKFRDPAAIADLERRCRALVADFLPAAPAAPAADRRGSAAARPEAKAAAAPAAADGPERAEEGAQ